MVIFSCLVLKFLLGLYIFFTSTVGLGLPTYIHKRKFFKKWRGLSFDCFKSLKEKERLGENVSK